MNEASTNIIYNKLRITVSLPQTPFSFQAHFKRKREGFSATLHVGVDCSEIVGVTGIAELFLC